jgi:hypothetical protein
MLRAENHASEIMPGYAVELGQKVVNTEGSAVTFQHKPTERSRAENNS